MDERKRFKRLICIILAALMLTPAAGALLGCNNDKNSYNYDENAPYSDTLFNTDYVHTVDVEISDSDWQDLNANPMNKTKYRVNVTVDGERVEEVSFATKGNTSLASVASDPDSSRYSFKINFGKYVKGQTYRGLNKLSLNNLYADAAYMKDYLSYELFRRAGVASPLVSYAFVSINGEAHGLYIAIEDISESYLARTANGEGDLYKPETEQLAAMGGAPGQGGQTPEGGPGQGGFPGGQGMTPPNGDAMPTSGMPGMTPPGAELPSGSDMPQPPDMPSGQSGQPGDFASSDKGASLAYTDDEISSYTDIFGNAVTDADEASNRRVIAALKALAEGGEVESCIDVEEVTRYFAAHNFVLNYDSYTGNMLHNYFLYENAGRLMILPWDYNLAFGAFAAGGANDAAALVNTGIDTPLSGASAEQRPLWALIANSPEYLEKYHKVYSDLIENYFDSGEFAKQIDSLYKMLLPYVKKDPSAFYSADEFTAAYNTLKSFCLLRAESIKKQLDGSLSKNTAEQQTADRVDASGIDINTMGTHMAGGMQPDDRPQGQGGQGMTPPNGQGMTPPDGQGMTPPNGQGGAPGGTGMNPPGVQP